MTKVVITKPELNSGRNWRGLELKNRLESPVAKEEDQKTQNEHFGRLHTANTSLHGYFRTAAFVSLRCFEIQKKIVLASIIVGIQKTLMKRFIYFIDYFPRVTWSSLDLFILGDMKITKIVDKTVANAIIMYKYGE